MILGIGLMVSIYLIFLSLPGALNAGVSKLKNHFLSRVTTLVLVIYLLFIIDSLYHWQGDVVFLDGLCKINASILTSEIYLLVLILAIVHLQAIYSRRPEFYLIILSNIIGLVYMISSNDWVITVTAWELFNLSLYLLVSINSSSEAALSAAIKYFLLSALTTTFLLLSVALLYALTGSTHYDHISLSLSMLDGNDLVQWPLLLMVITFLFKLGAAPFYNWAPDLYDAVPTTTTAWMTHIPKLAVLAFLMQIYHLLQPMELIFILAGVASLIVGSIGLGSQWRIKRFLAYSAISHLGFLLLALASLQFDSYMLYLIIYGLTSVNLFAILLAIGQAHWSGSNQREVLLISQLAGLFKSNQPLALAWSLSLFSLAGIPPLSGFYAKLSVLQAYLNLGYYWIAIIAILASVVSAANYLYLVKVSHFDLPLYSTSLYIPRSISYLISILSTFTIFFIFKPATFLILSSQLLFILDFSDLSLGLTFLPLMGVRSMSNKTHRPDKGYFKVPFIGH
uniref:NADH-ubiquinone oxidoreductase chain 2 n=1 Tax=Spizellomyces punctatus TaxID=109760 RepID=Q950R5_SPIPN|nr:NADH dehydrogenase subunit 2 [Spizellomyces punctatus]AAK84243.1 NADH dehydrogenase subunit 2 [Spizellomyces punctatus]